MSDTFNQLKQRSASGEAFELISFFMRYDLGTHKKTKLKLAGAAKSNSLLHNDVANSHGDKLYEEYRKYLDRLGARAAERLRFLTILHSTEDIEGDDVKSAVSGMEIAYKNVLENVGLWSLGAVELEVVNLSLLKRIKGVKDDEARKLNVLENLITLREFQGSLIPKSPDHTRVLVHLHSVVDLGTDYEVNEKILRELLNGVNSWKKSPYQIELKKFFSDKPIAKSLKHIAAYLTKGGNEKLRYNAGFGRDLAEDLDALIWRKGLGRADQGSEKIEDERGLTIGEVKRLDELYCWLMKRRNDQRGYILVTEGR